MVESETERDGKISRERRYYLSSARLDAATFARAVRGHWGIKDRLHWVLDVVFRDDLARLRTGHGPANMAVVKHLAVNLLREARPTVSLKGTVKLVLARIEKQRRSSARRPHAAALGPVTSAQIANACARTARYSAAGR
jgi:hypothetical protein